MTFRTRIIDSQTIDDGARADVYWISEGNQVIGAKTVQHPAAGPLIEIATNLVIKPLTTQTLS